MNGGHYGLLQQSGLEHRRACSLVPVPRKLHHPGKAQLAPQAPERLPRIHVDFRVP
jgi:hypothetical protein